MNRFVQRLIIGAVVSCTWLHGQEQLSLGSFRDGGSAQGSGPETIVREVNEVSLIFSVRDGRGRFRNDLTLDQMSLRDNGRVPAKICHFEAQSELPLRVAIVIDTSGSVEDQFKAEKKAAIGFLHKAIRPGIDRALIIDLNNEMRVIHGFSDDVASLERSLKRLTVGGGTPLYDAVFLAATELGQETQATERRVVVLISDGQENNSRRSSFGVIQALLQVDAVVYALSSNFPEADGLLTDQARGGERVLRSLADATGGRVISALGGPELRSAFRKIQQELRSQYVLAYKPAVFFADGSYHSIRLEAKGRHRMHFQVKSGYYSTRVAVP
jgi:VWFA-related protein